MKKYLGAAAVAVTVLLSGCGSKLDGTYKDSMGLTSYTFKSDKVTVSTMGMGTEMDYKVEDGKVKIISPQGTIVMDINKDGSIEGPMGVKLIKQKE